MTLAFYTSNFCMKHIKKKGILNLILTQNSQEDKEKKMENIIEDKDRICLLYTSPSPRDRTRSRMPSSA